MLNRYMDEAQLAGRIAGKSGRDEIGGLWDELGNLQKSFLVSRGLKAHHRILDLGCGCMRAGVKIVPVVSPGHYYGIDISTSLLEAGRKELRACSLLERVPDENLRVTDNFDISGFPNFDFGIAQSVFSHLPIRYLSDCLAAIKPNFSFGGRLYATFFIAPEDVETFQQLKGGVVTHSARDPFHTTTIAIALAAERQGWDFNWIGEWAHPRGQQMAEFTVKLP